MTNKTTLIGSMLLLGGVATASFGQTPTPTPTGSHLEVLPKTMSRRDVFNVMKGFTQGLGVRCQFCHEYKGDNPDDLTTFSFPADGKAEKKTALAMMKMAAAINNDLLKGIGEAAAPDQAKVTCYTCHRGEKKPLTQRPPQS